MLLGTVAYTYSFSVCPVFFFIMATTPEITRSSADADKPA